MLRLSKISTNLVIIGLHWFQQGKILLFWDDNSKIWGQGNNNFLTLEYNGMSIRWGVCIKKTEIEISERGAETESKWILWEERNKAIIYCRTFTC